MPRDSKINEHKASLCLHFILISIFVPILYPPYRASGRSQTKKSNFAGFLETESQKNRTISREFHGNFRGKLGWKAIGTKMADFVVIFRENFDRNRSVNCAD